MSRVLSWSVVPVEPTELGASGHPLKGLILDALQCQESDAAGVVIAKGDATATFLRGALATLPSRQFHAGRGKIAAEDVWRYDLREELAAFLATLDERGALLLGVRE